MKSLLTTSDVPQGISMPLRRISRGASMAELVLIREQKSFEELAEQKTGLILHTASLKVHQVKPLGYFILSLEEGLLSLPAEQESSLLLR